MAEKVKPPGGQPSGDGDAEPGKDSYFQDTARDQTSQAPSAPPHLPMGLLPVAARHRLTDMGNAERMVAAHGCDLRYCEPLGGWLAWDGKCWSKDETGETTRRAKSTVQGMYVSAAAEMDDSQRRELIRWTLTSESAQRIRAMLYLASTEIEVVAKVADFDAHPWLLNVNNGTLDLRTGELREHRRDDMLTKLAPVDYDPEATHPMFERYLSNVTGDDDEFAAYLQRAVGYTLTGLTREECFFLMLGKAGGGKSSLIEALLAMFGEGYGVKSSFETFMEAGKGAKGGASPDIARLRGARIVAAVETKKGRRLDEVLVKELTGGDTVTARHLYHEPISFKPTFKLWLAANDSPVLTDTDTGIWRRLQRLPFEHTLPENQRDPAVKEAMQGEALPALLAWAVRGCLAWQQQGLEPCDTVREKTAELRAEFDPLAEFFADCCTFIHQAETPAADLRQAYEEWAEGMGGRPINDREWGKRLESKGCQRLRTRVHGTKMTVWRGIGLLDAFLDTPDTPRAVSAKVTIGGKLRNTFSEQPFGMSGVSTDSQATDLWADLKPPEPAPGIPTGKPIRVQVSRARIQELMDQGFGRAEAEYIALAELETGEAAEDTP